MQHTNKILDWLLQEIEFQHIHINIYNHAITKHVLHVYKEYISFRVHAYILQLKFSEDCSQLCIHRTFYKQLNLKVSNICTSRDIATCIAKKLINAWMLPSQGFTYMYMYYFHTVWVNNVQSHFHLYSLRLCIACSCVISFQVEGTLLTFVPG